MKQVLVKDGTSLYSGEVTVTLKHGERTYKVIKQHNQGTQAFFEYIFRSIAGVPDASKRPMFLYLEAENGESVLSYGVPYESDSQSDSKKTPYRTIYTESLPGDNIVTSMNYNFMLPNTLIPRTFSFTGFRINAGDSNGFDDKVYAKVSFDSPIQVTSNSNLVVTWKLSITNG